MALDIELATKTAGETSSSIRQQVVTARSAQAHRFSDRKGIFCNADMGSREIKEFCPISDAGSELLKIAMIKLGLSARAYDRILKVSKTIADLAAAKISLWSI
ncbi:MAG: hypothetical protein Q8P51_09235 [Ignavibacteria bacterium]|nr:hypothetical protein [Ignavibacteria bacterium]